MWHDNLVEGNNGNEYIFKMKRVFFLKFVLTKDMATFIELQPTIHI